jgi:small nuclear ribonucleoprotein (snRNP)-like protein
LQLFERYPTLRQVIVNTKTDRAFRGVVWKRTRGYLVLRNVEMLRAKGETTPMDGEVLIESSNVDFIQVI